jgi:threonine dehydratase
MILPAAPDVLAAAHRLRGVIQRTPCSYSAPLSARTGAEIYVKWESQQNTGSFKLRGAFNALLTMPNEERRRAWWCRRQTRHRYAARTLGMRARVFIPATAPDVKRDGIAAMGAEVDADHADYDAAHEAALMFQTSGRCEPVHRVVAGRRGTGARDSRRAAGGCTLVVPVGGGGLPEGSRCSCAPHVRIIGVQRS